MDIPFPWNSLPEVALTRLRCDLGKLVFRQGAPANGLVFLHSGRIILKRYTASGDEVVLHRARSGQTIAEASLFSDIYHCDAHAQTICDYTLISKGAVLTAMKVDSDFSCALNMKFAQQIQESRRLVEITRIKNAKQRVLEALKIEFSKGDEVDWKAFAAEINLSHEAVYRALAALVNEGVLIKNGRGTYKLITLT